MALDTIRSTSTPPHAQHNPVSTAERLSRYLAAYARAYPGAWRAYESAHLHHRTRPGWPSWCFAPLGVAAALVHAALHGHARSRALGQGALALRLSRDASVLAGLAAWRLGQGVYRFDQEVFEAVWNTPLEGTLPLEVLTRLPQWGVYVETPGVHCGEARLAGFLAFLHWDAARREAELFLLLDLENLPLPLATVGRAGLWPLGVPLTGGTLKDAVERATREGELGWQRAGLAPLPRAKAASVSWHHLPARLVSLLVYLCSESAAYSGSERPQHAQPRRVKGGARLFPAERVVTWLVGERMGAALRRARAGHDQGERDPSGGRSVRPHVRRAHYHGFWRGPREERELVVRWLPPIPVKFDQADQQPVVVHRVQGQQQPHGGPSRQGEDT